MKHIHFGVKQKDYSFDIRKQKVLNHYTTLTSLLSILGNRSFRLSRIDKVNDLMECKRIDDFEKTKGFVGCFTKREKESYFFWKSYSQQIEGEIGVRISFPSEILSVKDFYFDSECSRPIFFPTGIDFKHQSYSKESDWGLRRSAFYKILYMDDIQKLKYVDTFLQEQLGDCINITENFERNAYPYIIKTAEWDQEEEVRLVAEARPLGRETVLGRTAFERNTYPQPPFSYIFLKIPIQILQECLFTISPFCMSNFEEVQKTILSILEVDPTQVQPSSMCLNVR